MKYEPEGICDTCKKPITDKEALKQGEYFCSDFCSQLDAAGGYGGIYGTVSDWKRLNGEIEKHNHKLGSI